MGAIRKLGRGKVQFAAAIAGMATLLAAGAALAQSVLLPPGVNNLAVPSTTAAAEPSLAGLVIHDALLPFTMKTPDGAVLCTGQLQNRVVRSKTGQLDFYYRIRDTTGIGLIWLLHASSFGELPLRVGFRTDGLGTAPPGLAHRGGATVTFIFNRLIQCGQESRFILIRTPALTFGPGGSTWLSSGTTPADAVVPTVMP